MAPEVDAIVSVEEKGEGGRVEVGEGGTEGGLEEYMDGEGGREEWFVE